MPPEGYEERKELQRHRDYISFMDRFNDKLQNSTKVKDTLSIDKQIEKAQRELDKAVESENYEEAAIQRDLLIELKEQ